MGHTFYVYKNYFGLLQNDGEGTLIYGFENISATNQAQTRDIHISAIGGCFIVVQSGYIDTEFGSDVMTLRSMVWQSTMNGARFKLGLNSRVVVFQKVDYLGLDAIGKPEI